jgi:sterol desaturase/sphingolipid hydroxylase (fatty acid hydroxylase superfamily)
MGARLSVRPLGRVAYYADFVTIPMLAIVAALVGMSPKQFSAPAVAAAIAAAWREGHEVTAVAAFGAGYLAWTLAEYLIHRFVFHRLYRRAHGAHHRRPDDYFGAQPWQALFGNAAAYGVLVALFGAALGACAAIGLFAGYLAYVFIHDRIHHESLDRRPRSWFVRQRAAHALHHSGVEVNFGVVHPLWDIVLRTYRAP